MKKRIGSLKRFLSEVKKIALPGSETAFPKIYFRGEANEEWKAEASLFRGKIGEDSFYKDVNYTKEGDLIASALIQYPQAFEKCPNAISRLVLMQHYGLPTRLYDVTANPLVALFFACNMEFDKNGKVLFTKPGLDLYSSDFVNPLAELNEEIENNGIILTLDNLLSYCIKKNLVHEGQEEAFAKKLFINVTKSFLFQPPLDNERIQRQKGAMIFSSLLTMPDKLAEENYQKLEQNDCPWKEIHSFLFMNGEVNLREMFAEDEFVIPKRYKKTILKELDMVGINEASVYPELEHQFKTIKYRNVPQSNWMNIKDLSIGKRRKPKIL